MDNAFQGYIEYFENISLDTVEKVRGIVTQDFHFVDPFNNVHGVEKVIEIFKDMFNHLRNPKFVVSDTVIDGDRMYIRWDFNFESNLLQGGPFHSIDGVSLIRKNNDGKIIEHIDFWDASTQLYCKIPILGWFTRLVRKWFQVK